jgi:predicted ABC-type ATPase
VCAPIAMDDDGKKDEGTLSPQFLERIVWREGELVVVSTDVRAYDFGDIEDQDGVWRTLNGRHVFIRKGESPTEAIERSKAEKTLEAARELVTPDAGRDASRVLQETFKYPPPDFAGQEYRVNAYLDHSASINAFLRREFLLGNDEISKTIGVLDKAFVDAPPLTMDMMVSRAVSRDVVKDLRLVDGATIKDLGFVSTSLSKRVVDEFIHGPSMIFDIRVPAGAKVLSVPSIRGLKSRFSQREAEVLLPRGSAFRILSVKGNVVQAELLPQGRAAMYAKQEIVGDGVWRTIKGRRVFIREGEDATTAIIRSKTEELERQKTLAAAQTNPLARPPFILGEDFNLSAANYIAAYGEEFKAGPLPEGALKGTPKECYRNASMLVMIDRNLTYAEGVAYSSAGLPYLHAWAVDKSGNVIDPTWENPEKAKYFGVKYDREKYLKYLYKAKMYGVLGSTDKNAYAAITTGGNGLRAGAEQREYHLPGRHDQLLHGKRGVSARGDDSDHEPERPSGGVISVDLSAYPRANSAASMLERRDGIDTLTQYTQADGSLTPERKALHDRIVAETVTGHAPSEGQAVVNLLGGGGASGKSTMQSQLGLPMNQVYVDVDIIRTKLPEWNKELVAARAEGRRANAMLGMYTHEESSLISKRVIEEAVRGKYNLLIDGAGDSTIDKVVYKIAKYREQGHKIVANYATVDYDTAYARMRLRGDRIGRYIPAAHLRAVHAEVSRVFPEAVKRGLFDEFALWDTGASKDLGGGKLSPPIKVASGKGTKMTIHNKKLYTAFLAKARGIATRTGEV